MSGASRRRIATAGRREPGEAVRFAIVALCVLGTACAYVAFIVVVVGGHIGVLIGLIPWLAATALAAILVVTLWAVVGASRERLQSRRALTAERIRVLAEEIRSLEPSQRAAAKKRLIERLDITREALSEVVNMNPAVRKQLVAGGVAAWVERELLGGGSKWHRVNAAGVLGLLGAPTSVERLTRALADPDVDVAYASAQALARYTSRSAYDSLLDALSAGTLPAPRVAGLLEAFQCPAARELIERRAGSDDPRLRYWAAYLLGSLADPRSAPVVECLTRDPDEDVRANAAESMAGFPDASTLRRLLADESWVVRSHAAKAAGASGQVDLAPRLAGLLEDRSWWVRQNATLALAAFGYPAVPSLLPQLRSHDRFARNKAAEALVRCGYAAEQVERLTTAASVDESARRFLIDLGRAEAVGMIEIALRDAPTPEGRARLTSVLEEIAAEHMNSPIEQLEAIPS